LRWKFKPGETLHYTTDQKTVLSARAPGFNTKSTLSQTIETTWTVNSVDSNGQAELTQTITRIRDQVEGTVGSYTYDSKDGKEPESLIAAGRVPLFKALLGVAVPFKMSSRGDLVEVRVPDRLVKALAELGPTTPGADALLSEAGLREVIGRASLVLPEEDLAEGKTWTFKTNSAQAAGALMLDSIYRNEGRAPDAGPGAVKIGVTVTAAIPPDDAQGNPRANKAKIESQKSQGTYIFDNAAGRVLDSTLTEAIEVSAGVNFGQGATAKEVQVVQSSESTTIRKLVKD
jgi:hypothetical protein